MLAYGRMKVKQKISQSEHFLFKPAFDHGLKHQKNDYLLIIITAQIIGQIINNHGRSRLAHGIVQIEEY